MGTAPSSTVHCPRCADSPGLQGAPDSSDGAVCPRCEGAFLGEAASRSLFEDTLHLTKDTLSAVAASVGGRSVTCPGCHNAMRYLRIRSAAIDFCFTCGSCWLDKGELAFLVSSSFPQDSGAPPPRAPVSPMAPGPPRPVERTLAMWLGAKLYPDDPDAFTWTRLLLQRAVFFPLLLLCVAQSVLWGMFFFHDWEWRNARQVEGTIIESSESQHLVGKNHRQETWCDVTLEFPWKDPPRVGRLSLQGRCAAEDRKGRSYLVYVNRHDGELAISLERFGPRMERTTVLFLSLIFTLYCFGIGARVLKGRR